jgi:hypothetical protein
VVVEFVSSFYDTKLNKKFLFTTWKQKLFQLVIADDIFKWIRNVSALNDEQLKQEIDLVHQSSIKAFARALAKVRRPEVDTHTIRNGALTEHDFSICFFQLVNKPLLQSTPTFQSARSHTMVALTWTLTLEPKF